MKTWSKTEVLEGGKHSRAIVAHIPCHALETARPSEAQGRPGNVKFPLPDDILKSIRGDEDRQPVFAIVIIPADVRKAMESPIIQPGVLEP